MNPPRASETPSLSSASSLAPSGEALSRLEAARKWIDRAFSMLVTSDDGSGVFIRGTGTELAGFEQKRDEADAAIRAVAALLKALQQKLDAEDYLVLRDQRTRHGRDISSPDENVLFDEIDRLNAQVAALLASQETLRKEHDVALRRLQEAHMALDSIGAPTEDGVGPLTLSGRCWELSNRWVIEQHAAAAALTQARDISASRKLLIEQMEQDIMLLNGKWEAADAAIKALQQKFDILDSDWRRLFALRQQCTCGGPEYPHQPHEPECPQAADYPDVIGVGRGCNLCNDYKTQLAEADAARRTAEQERDELTKELQATRAGETARTDTPPYRTEPPNQ